MSDVAEIALANGLTCLVSESDLSMLKPYRLFSAVRGRYVQIYKDGKKVYLHRFLTGAVPGQCVDHVDGNGLNNTRSNLRLCSNAENCRNKKKQPGHTSKYKGVAWFARDGRWMARIKHKRIERFLGYFDDEADAAMAYNEAALDLFGQFANLNEAPQTWERNA